MHRSERQTESNVSVQRQRFFHLNLPCLTDLFEHICAKAHRSQNDCSRMVCL